MSNSVCHILYSGLGGHGHVVMPLVSQEADFKCLLMFYGIESISPEYQRFCELFDIPFLHIHKNKGQFLLPLFRIYKSLKRNKSDCVVVHSSNALIPALFYSKLYGKKVVFVEHHSNKLKSIHEWALSLIANLFSQNIVYLSQSYLNIVKKRLRWFFANKKAQLIPNGVDLEVFKPLTNLKKRRTIKLGIATRIAPSKDLTTLILAFNSILEDNIELHIAGIGEDFAKVKTLAERSKKNDSIVFHGFLKGNDLVSFYQDLDIYIQSSFGETMSTAIAQAQACGLPIVGSDVEGINNVIKSNENGFLFSTQEELVSILSDLISSESQRVKLGILSREYAEKHLSLELMLERYNKLYS